MTINNENNIIFHRKIHFPGESFLANSLNAFRLMRHLKCLKRGDTEGKIGSRNTKRR
jgi:hypothetical protein